MACIGSAVPEHTPSFSHCCWDARTSQVVKNKVSKISFFVTNATLTMNHPGSLIHRSWSVQTSVFCFSSMTSQTSHWHLLCQCELILCFYVNVLLCVWTNVFVLLCVYVCVAHFTCAGLRDNYSTDDLFSGMRYNNKRSRARIQLQRQWEKQGWRTSKLAESTSLTSVFDWWLYTAQQK